jgi:hypothetical protein
MGGIIQVDSVLNNNTSNLITQTNSTTITIGSTGQTISLASGASSSGFGLSWNPTVQSTNFTASVNVGYMVNTSSAVVTVTLPASPSIGDQIQFVDYNETAAINSIILNGNGLKIDGVTAISEIKNSGEGVTILYTGTTRGWIPVSAVNEGTTALISQYSVDFLVIAGGGSGGSENAAGGGGAGGYRLSNATYGSSGGGASAETSLNFTRGSIYTITVGGGGAIPTGDVQNGGIGTNSSISGTGITTITSNGGGGGSGNGAVPTSGGSGGGGADQTAYNTGASGTANQGYAGGNAAGTNAGYNGGGGGGAGAVGGNGVSGPGGSSGSGGAGVASTITGSSVTRAGGGGGTSYNGTAGTGGTGGGGNGSRRSVTVVNGTAGTANTGGGGGAGASTTSARAYAGGSGIVILRMATVHYTGITSGSPTVTTSGSDTILTFNGSGTYTA